MLSEEEKEAIKLLEDIKNNSWTTKYIMSSDSKNADILLNLITKLQKENEKKDKQIYELVKYIDSNNYVDNEECQFQWDFKIEKCIANEDCIQKQKIKDKIEELKRQRRELGFKTYLKKEDIINDDRVIMCEISVLQELLQESEDK